VEPAPPHKPATKRPDDSAARARLGEMKEALSGAEAEERQARRHWRQTQRELEEAQAAVARAQRELDELVGA
jgi:chromosome segregation ATPase